MQEPFTLTTCFSHRILGAPVCTNLWKLIVQESADTYRPIRKAIKPSADTLFDKTALFKINRLDEKGPQDLLLGDEDLSRQDWFGPVRHPNTELQKLFISSFGKHVVKIFGEALPHKSIRLSSSVRIPQINIPNGLFSSKGALLQQLQAQQLLPATLGSDTFYHLLRKFYPHVCIQKWTPFSKCDVCSRIKQELFGAASEEAAAKLHSELAAHRAFVTLGRQRLAARSLIARAQPGWALSLIADGMDSAKTFSPHVTSHFVAGKSLTDKGYHLKTKLLGVLSEGQSFYGFITYPHYSGGPNILCSALHISLRKQAERNQNYLPPVLLLQLDNCGGDNKNHTVFAYLGYLVQIGVFHTILVDFLIVGKFITCTNINATPTVFDNLRPYPLCPYS